MWRFRFLWLESFWKLVLEVILPSWLSKMFECYECQAQLPLPVPQQLSCIGLLQHGIHMDPGWASSIGYVWGRLELYTVFWSCLVFGKKVHARANAVMYLIYIDSFRSFDICCCCNGPQIPPSRFLSGQTWFLTWLLLVEASKAQLIHLYDGSPYSSFSIGTLHANLMTRYEE